MPWLLLLPLPLHCQHPSPRDQGKRKRFQRIPALPAARAGP
jgi:hypothetical protein